jgi:hypothetical protein
MVGLFLGIFYSPYIGYSLYIGLYRQFGGPGPYIDEPYVYVWWCVGERAVVVVVVVVGAVCGVRGQGLGHRTGNGPPHDHV